MLASSRLLDGATSGDLRCIIGALEDGAEVDERDERKATALMLASSKGYADIVDFLLTKGASVNALDQFRQSCLLLAAKEGHQGICFALLEKRANPDEMSKNRYTPLLFAAQQGHEDIVKSLLTHSATVDHSDEWKYTPLMKAAHNGHIGVVLILLAGGANIDAKDKKNWTALHVAASQGHIEVVKVLLEHGANAYAQTNIGKTATDIASNDKIKTLLKKAMQKKKAAKEAKEAKEVNAPSSGKKTKNKSAAASSYEPPTPTSSYAASVDNRDDDWREKEAFQEEWRLSQEARMRQSEELVLEQAIEIEGLKEKLLKAQGDSFYEQSQAESVAYKLKMDMEELTEKFVRTEEAMQQKTDELNETKMQLSLCEEEQEKSVEKIEGLAAEIEQLKTSLMEATTQHDREKQHLEEKIKETNDRLKFIEEQSKTDWERSSALQTQLEQARLRSDQQRFKTEELLKIAQQEAEHQKDSNQTLSTQIQNMMQETQIENKNYTNFIEKLQQEIESLRKQLQDERTAHSETKSILLATKAERDSLLSECATLRHRLEALGLDLEAATQSSESQSSLLSSSTTEKEKLQSELENERKRVKKLQQGRQSLIDQLGKAEKTMGTLVSELSEAKKREEAQKETISRLEGTCLALRNELKDAITKSENVQVELAYSKQRDDENSQNLNTLISELRNGLFLAEKARDSAEEEASALRQEKREFGKEKGEIQARRRALEAELVDMKDARDKHLGEIQELKNSVSSLEVALAAVTGQRDVVFAEKAEIERLLDGEVQKKEALEKDVANLKDMMAKEHDKLKASSFENASAFNGTREKMQKEIESLEHQCKEMEHQMRMMTDDAAGLKKKLSSLEEKNAGYSKLIAELKSIGDKREKELQQQTATNTKTNKLLLQEKNQKAEVIRLKDEEIKVLAEQMGKYKENLGKIQKDKAAVETQLEEEINKRLELSRNVAGLKAENQGLTETLSLRTRKEDDRVSQLQLEATKARDQVKRLEMELGACVKEKEFVQEEAKMQLDAMAMEVSRAIKHEQNEAAKKIHQMTMEMSGGVGNNKQLAALYEKAEVGRITAESQVRSLTSDLEAAKLQIEEGKSNKQIMEELEQKISKLQDELCEAEAANSSATSLLMMAEETSSRWQQECQTLKRLFDEQTARTSRNQNDADDAEKEKDNGNNSNNEEVVVMKQQLDSLNEMLNSKNEELETCCGMMQEMSDRTKTLELENKLLSDRLRVKNATRLNPIVEISPKKTNDVANDEEKQMLVIAPKMDSYAQTAQSLDTSQNDDRLSEFSCQLHLDESTMMEGLRERIHDLENSLLAENIRFEGERNELERLLNVEKERSNKATANLAAIDTEMGRIEENIRPWAAIKEFPSFDAKDSKAHSLPARLCRLEESLLLALHHGFSF